MMSCVELCVCTVVVDANIIDVSCKRVRNSIFQNHYSLDVQVHMRI